MKTVAEFIAEWKVYGDDKEFFEALAAFKREIENAAYKDGYRHGIEVGQEQQILSNSPLQDED